MPVARALQVERQQAAQDFFVGHRRGVIRPVIGGGYGGIERLVRMVEPGGTGVVEIGQRALFQVGFVAGFGYRAQREAGTFFLGRALPIDPFQRVEPRIAQLIEALRGDGDGAVGRCVGGIAGRQAGWEGEGFEGGGWRVARTVFERRAEAQRPQFVEAGMQDAEGGVVSTGYDGASMTRQNSY